jgi:hypothetical protein
MFAELFVIKGGQMASPAYPNVYTHAPALHPNLLVGTVQILFWLAFHPTAWRNYVTQLDTNLEPDFCLLQVPFSTWRQGKMLRLIISLYFIWPLMAGLIGSMLLALVRPTTVADLFQNMVTVSVVGLGMNLVSGLLFNVAAGVWLNGLSFLWLMESQWVCVVLSVVGGLCIKLAVGPGWNTLRGLALSFMGGLIILLIFTMGWLVIAGIVTFMGRAPFGEATLLIFFVALLTPSFTVISKYGDHNLGRAPTPNPFKSWITNTVFFAIILVVGFIVLLPNAIRFYAAFFIPIALVAVPLGISVGLKTNLGLGVSVALLCGGLFALLVAATVRVDRVEGLTTYFISTLFNLPEGLLTSLPRYLLVSNPLLTYFFAFCLFVMTFTLMRQISEEPLAPSLAAATVVFLELFTLFNPPVEETRRYMLIGVICLLGATIQIWRPMVFYFVGSIWHRFLWSVDQRDARPDAPHALSQHMAFWDEHQSWRWPELDKHLLLLMEQSPTEARQAMEFLAKSPQAWAVERAQSALKGPQFK